MDKCVLSLICAEGAALTEDQLQRLSQLYEDLSKEFPKSDMIQRFPLDFTSGDLFAQKAAAYLKPRLRKGVPSLFIDIKPLYSNKAKVWRFVVPHDIGGRNNPAIAHLLR